MKSVVNCRDPLNQLRVQKRMTSLNKNNVTCIQMVQPEVMPKTNVIKKHYSSWISKKNKVHVVKTKPNNMPATFQQSLRATLLIGQVFGLIPVAGLLRYDQKGVRFNWMSWRCLHLYLLFCGQLFTTLMCIYNMSHSETSLKGTSPAIFYATTCITMTMFLQVASNLPKLTKHVIRTEDLDPNFDANLKFVCNMTCAVVLILALFEHILSLVSAYTAAMMCYPDIHIYEGFVKQSYPWIFKFLPYSTVLGMTTQFLHFQATFIWNFSDLFVIVMSYYLTSRLENVNKKLILAQGKYFSELFWRTTREEYGRATQLVRKVDEVISGIVFISFANNLFFVCLQLFNTLEDGIKGTEECRGNRHRYGKSPFGGYEAAAYFLFSLVYLICRSVAVSLIASQVNTASTVPAPVLYDVPSPVYCIEVQRFIDHVNGEKVALSGLQFFTVTRGLLLTVAGTIVTYELVMFQFKTQQPTLSPTVTNVTVA